MIQLYLNIYIIALYDFREAKRDDRMNEAMPKQQWANKKIDRLSKKKIICFPKDSEQAKADTNANFCDNTRLAIKICRV